MNYPELVAAIRGYAENEFPDSIGFSSEDQIASFIRAVEQKLTAQLQMPALKSNMVGTTEAGNPYLTLPIDFLAFDSAAIVLPNGDYKYLLDKSESFIREAYPNPNKTGEPEYISIFGPDARGPAPITRTSTTAAILGPTPAEDYPIEVHYLYVPLSITDTVGNPTGRSWLGDNFDTLLLYGALLEAGLYMQMGEEYMGRLRDLYNESLAVVGSLNSGRTSVGAYRSRAGG